MSVPTAGDPGDEHPFDGDAKRHDGTRAGATALVVAFDDAPPATASTAIVDTARRDPAAKGGACDARHIRNAVDRGSGAVASPGDPR